MKSRARATLCIQSARQNRLHDKKLALDTPNGKKAPVLPVGLVRKEVSSGCDDGSERHRQSPKLIPASLAVSTTSWLGSTRFGSRNASSIGIATMCGDCSATMYPHF